MTAERKKDAPYDSQKENSTPGKKTSGAQKKIPSAFVTKKTMVILLIIIFVLLAALAALLIHMAVDYRENKQATNDKFVQVDGKVDANAEAAAAGLADLTATVDANAETAAAGLSDLTATVTANAETAAAGLNDLTATVTANAETAAAGLNDLTATVTANAETAAAGLSDLTATVTANAETAAAGLADLTATVDANAETAAAGLSDLTATVTANAETAAAGLNDLTATVTANAETAAAGLADLTATVTANAETAAAGLADLTATVTANAETAATGLADLTATVDANAEEASATQERVGQIEGWVAEYERRNAITVAVGDVVSFGRYEQDGNTANGPESIDWVVLDIQGNKALLVSRYVLEQLPYSITREETLWEHSYPREWLNDSFINNAFTEVQRGCILTTVVDNGDNTGVMDYGRLNGSSTSDRVFLLSYEETVKYFGRSENRVTRPTAAVISTGITCDNKTGFCTWWLRSTGCEPAKNANIYMTGIIHNSWVDSSNVGIRPAMWVDYTAKEFSN